MSVICALLQQTIRGKVFPRNVLSTAHPIGVAYLRG